MHILLPKTIKIHAHTHIFFYNNPLHEPGAEAMFADLGHFNVRAVQVSK